MTMMRNGLRLRRSRLCLVHLCLCLWSSSRKEEANRNRKKMKMVVVGKWWIIGMAVGMVGVVGKVMKEYGWEKEVALRVLTEWSQRLGVWAIPAYVAIHTITIALCLPYAIFFEAAASLLFGFLPAVLCVFSAKLLGASLSFWIGRLVFRSSSSAMEWVQRNKYFHILSKGVERDGWKFVLLARFSPMPSYLINYALAATNVGFIVDFLLPTVIGCLPMILQNTSIGSLAGAAVASASGSQKSQVLSYLFPVLGIASSVLISLRIKKYSTDISEAEISSNEHVHDSNRDVMSSQNPSNRREQEILKKGQ